MPRQCASSAMPGRTSVWCGPQKATGVWSASRPAASRRASASGSVPGSRVWTGCPLRVRKRCRRSVSADRRDPTRVTAACPWEMKAARRRMNARITISATSGSAASIRRNWPRESRATRPSAPIRPPTRIARSVKRSSSPVNWCVACTVITCGAPSSPSGCLVDLDEALQHEEEVDAAVVDLEQDRARGELLHTAELRHPCDLLLAQCRERVLGAGVGIRRAQRRRQHRQRVDGRLRHDSSGVDDGGATRELLPRRHDPDPALVHGCPP